MFCIQLPKSNSDLDHRSWMLDALLAALSVALLLWFRDKVRNKQLSPMRRQFDRAALPRTQPFVWLARDIVGVFGVSSEEKGPDAKQAKCSS
ncbi:hypothetical protein BO86DRAFT_178948 [Aspergillus japonicus CBS 114.51]|uniref:Uncharacterized protein n=2 Tax=Aspergillus TaxID=5052 RepID=A0A2V5HVQ4_ASPV1|nr:hypothetical protein BO86DRAFT_178948 [Aspergillus japonicus CBS 114.51]PYI15947.1 hypothetical protein BO99DRAFT_236152 [Aspergillus violaceofuscus CBS 115571]RAH78593.1 hypothetical protein BO86DRAFT_178948 [Aspergillus japonicus CBS 114.51]